MLNDFDVAYTEEDYEKMNECARMLTDFNGGDSVITKYIEKVDLSLPQDTILAVDDTKRSEVGDKPVPDQRIMEFFDGVVAICNDQYKVISTVFPNPSVVMKQLIQRVFDFKVSF
jgi:hypothetical protein